MRQVPEATVSSREIKDQKPETSAWVNSGDVEALMSLMLFWTLKGAKVHGYVLNMDIYDDESEYSPDHIPMFHKVMDMFEGKPDFHRLVQLSILANVGHNVDYEYTCTEGHDLDGWVHSANRSEVHSYGFSGSRLSSSSPQPRPQSNTDAGILGASKEEEKAEKKRLKRQKRKERKRIEKEKQNMDKNKEEKDENKPENEKSKPNSKEQAAAKDSEGSDGSEDYFSGEDLSGYEELDMTSTFVSKARSKLEQKPKPEKEKKIPAKEPKPNPAEADKEVSASAATPTIEDNIKISTQLANLGNMYANAGDFKTAVQHYTDAIKHNPREYKLFGNRSFCFEKMRLYMKALDDAELSLGMYPGWVKGLFRKGRALAGLKRYAEAERAFRQVLEVDSSRADAIQELRRVQIAQIMDQGYTSEQSAHALNTHKSVKKALLFLMHSTHQPVNLSSAPPLKPYGAPETTIQDTHSPKASQNSHHQELYPIWVGNLFCPVSESSLEQLFNKVGPVRSVRLLTYKRCAFVNFTTREDCEQAIRRFHGFDFNGTKIAVRYPDRIPSGMGISRSALTSDDWQENATGRDAAGSRRDSSLYRSANH